MSAHSDHTITIRAATSDDVPLVLEFIRELARYERLEHEVSASAAELREAVHHLQTLLYAAA